MTTTALSDLMSSLSGELSALSAAVEEMFILVENDRAENAAQGADYIRAAQSIDHTHQHLANLSEFLRLLADDMPEEWQVELARPLQSVRLADLKRRLSVGSPLDRPPSADGELELF